MAEQAEGKSITEQEREINLLANYRPIGIRAVMSACLAQKRSSTASAEPIDSGRAAGCRTNSDDEDTGNA
ncbi:hypothetical protein [Sinorhizobium medicae]|uniref:hypothetical protein n=1 Tax=Sinorhizobium medicae TaxID=110321 RepID=UPI000B499C1A|nr:hypothetical protein [Sinorhizobium medicae]ASP89536.1 hypothetical protein CDO26_35690 [Sinorhizobium meliloti]MDX0518950.1 hypothetical protein [Sinorhizobium medicae]MDX0568461.1 hypothetical protein [Sinorhizobium medicae]MDX0581227.1 hypothetical protein [Sinorhizobium medicae]MDX0729381.1 hypothetical protein [Sinorhizobium medicae]